MKERVESSYGGVAVYIRIFQTKPYCGQTARRDIKSTIQNFLVFYFELHPNTLQAVDLKIGFPLKNNVSFLHLNIQSLI
jgi:hypothetical protein